MVNNEHRTTNQLEVSRLAWKKLQVYRDVRIARTRIFEWHRRFREGREDVEDDPRSGRSTTNRTNENVERVGEKMGSDRHLTIGMIAVEWSINSERLRTIIIEDPGMRKVCAKMILRLLNDEQKEPRGQVFQGILKELETEPDMLNRVATDDESWIFEYDPLTKRQSLEWKSASSPRPKKAKLFKSKIKVMLIVFFDVYKIVYTKFVPQGRPLTSTLTKTFGDL